MNAKPVVLITGCSSGIGRCAARVLAGRGWRVLATVRRAGDIDALEDEGLESLVLDLDDSRSIREAVAEALRRSGGHMDAVFHNGGYGQPGAVEDLSREALRAQFETLVFGWMELNNALIPVMRRRGHGRIVFNSSVLGLVALAYRGAYNAAKFAIEALADTLRVELRGTGIDVSVIEPGPILTRFRAHAREAFERYIDAERSVHRAVYEKMIARLAHEGAAVPFTLPPEAVIKKLVHALESRRPKPRYYVTVPTYVLAATRRLLTARGLDRLLRWMARGEQR